MIRNIRAAFKLFLLVLLTGSIYLALILCDAAGMTKSRFKMRVRKFYQICMRAIFNLKITQEGKMVSGPALIISNHVSYIDVNAIWSTADADLCFTPKSDVKDWPFIGSITKRFDNIFVDRTPGKSKDTQLELQRVLHEGRAICVFAEATTSDGRNMKPFRSSLFSLAEQWEGATPLPVQPVSLIYQTVDGVPMNEENWPRVGWFGDDTFGAHFWRFLLNESVTAKVIYHSPVALQQGETRKELCRRTEVIVRNSIPHVKPLEVASDEPAVA